MYEGETPDEWQIDCLNVRTHHTMTFHLFGERDNVIARVGVLLFGYGWKFDEIQIEGVFQQN